MDPDPDTRQGADALVAGLSHPNEICTRGGSINTIDSHHPSCPASAGNGRSPDGQAGTLPGSRHDRSQSGPQHPAPQFVERKTALRGQAIASRRLPASVVRKSTESDLHEKDPEIPYVKTERAIRDLVCSVLERQDRMNEEILLRVIDLQYRVEDLEADRQQEMCDKTGEVRGVPG